MALVPVIQPPIMKALTTQKEREIVMQQLRKVSKKEENRIPDRREFHLRIVTLTLKALLQYRMSDAGNLVGAAMRCGRTLEQNGSKRVDEYLYDIFRDFRRSDHDSPPLS